MKEKNGFTLVELLAVIILIAIITTIGTVGVLGVKDAINGNLWEGQISLIESRAEVFGEDNKIIVENSTCGDIPKCLDIKVQTLLDRKYLSSKEKNDDDQKIIVNETLSEDDPCYIINDWVVRITIDNDIIYSELIPDESCQKVE